MTEKGSIHDEAALMQQFRAGNEAAFTTVYKHLYRRVYWFAKKYVGDITDVQDLTAETFVQLWHRHHAFDSLDGVAAFLHVTVRNKCFNLLKQQQMKAGHHVELLHLLSEEDTNTFFTEQLRMELMRRIYAEVEKLPPRMKEVLLLSYQEGLKPAQIAERLQIKVQTVINQRVNAVKLLQLALSREPLLLALLLLIEQEHRFLA